MGHPWLERVESEIEGLKSLKKELKLHLFWLNWTILGQIGLNSIDLE